MTEWTCPVDDCEFGTDQHRTRRAVLSHINAKGDSDHDQRARAVVDALDDPPVPDLDDIPDVDAFIEQGQAALEGASASDTEGDGEGNGDSEGEAESEGPEATDEGASGSPESDTDTDDMATPDEYEEQRSALEGGDEGTEKGAPSGESDPEPEAPAEGDDNPPSQGATEGGSGIPFPSVERRTVYLLVGAVAVALVAYWMFFSDTSESDAGVDDDPDSEGSEQGAQAESEGGDAAEEGPLWDDEE